MSAFTGLKVAYSCLLLLMTNTLIRAVTLQPSDGNRDQGRDENEGWIRRWTIQMENILSNINDKLETLKQNQESLELKLDDMGRFLNTCNQNEVITELTNLIINRDALMAKHIRDVIGNCSPSVSDVAPNQVGLPRPRDCADIRALGNALNGVYTVYVGDSNRPIVVHCDMTTASGGWTVIQRRQDGSVDFFLDWESYQIGFGNVNGEFWIGNDNLHLLTSAKRYKLRVELTAFDGSTAYAQFDNFKVESADDKYRLSSIGNYSGTAGNSLSYHVGQQFSTKDQDNDSWASQNCAARHRGAWWYFASYLFSNLNGNYYSSPSVNNDGLRWMTWKEFSSLKRTEMKITPFV